METSFKNFLNISIKRMKLSAEDKYIFIDNNKIVSVSNYCIKCIIFHDLVNSDYNNKIISVDFIKGKTNTSFCETNLGVLDCRADDYISIYKCQEYYNSIIYRYNIYNNYKSTCMCTTYENISDTNEDIMKMRNLKSADGCMNVRLDNNHIVTLSPTFIPMTKSNSLSVNIYENNSISDNKFQCEFNIYSDGVDISILSISMFFLKI